MGSGDGAHGCWCGLWFSSRGVCRRHPRSVAPNGPIRVSGGQHDSQPARSSSERGTGDPLRRGLSMAGSGQGGSQNPSRATHGTPSRTEATRSLPTRSWGRLPRASPFLVYPWFARAASEQRSEERARLLQAPPWIQSRPDISCANAATSDLGRLPAKARRMGRVGTRLLA